jgi:hypothetical protein
VSDSAGRYALTGVPDGRYIIGFVHPILDSLGIEPTLREARVTGGRALHIDLATPGPSALRAAICGASASRDSGAVLVGVIRDARHEPVLDAVVMAEWLEVTLSANGLARQTPRITATSKANGWFALCNVPNAGTIFVSAARGDVTTDVIELPIPAERFVRRALYLGAARPGVTDSSRRAGSGRVSGVVRTAVEGRPLPGAQVSMIDGPETRANERGEWTLADAPGGTRMLEVRAIGYYPRRLPADVVEDAPPVRVELTTMKAVLDTVRINARREDLRRSNGFEDRRRSTIGQFLTDDDVLRRRPFVTSDLFKMVPGMMVVPTSTVTQITLRSMFGGRCIPSVFIDGTYMFDLSADDIDGFVSPDEIAGIEIYSGLGVPPQFSAGNYGLGPGGRPKEPCGAVAIWTKQGRKRPPVTRAAALRAVGFIGLGLLVGNLFFQRR